jgi:hypothetical protein
VRANKVLETTGRGSTAQAKSLGMGPSVLPLRPSPGRQPGLRERVGGFSTPASLRPAARRDGARSRTATGPRSQHPGRWERAGFFPRPPRSDPLRAGTARGPGPRPVPGRSTQDCGRAQGFFHARLAPARCAPGRRAVRTATGPRSQHPGRWERAGVFPRPTRSGPLRAGTARGPGPRPVPGRSTQDCGRGQGFFHARLAPARCAPGRRAVRSPTGPGSQQPGAPRWERRRLLLARAAWWDLGFCGVVE